MPQFNTITLLGTDMNSTSPEGDLEFLPTRLNGAVATLQNKTYSEGNYAALPTLTLSSILPSKASKLQKVRLKLVLPQSSIDADGNDIPGTKDFESTADISFFIPEKASEVHRIMLINTVRGLLANVGVVEHLVTQAETIY